MPMIEWIVMQDPNPDFHGEEWAAAMRSRIGEGTTTVLVTDDCRGTFDLADLQRGTPSSISPAGRERTCSSRRSTSANPGTSPGSI